MVEDRYDHNLLRGVFHKLTCTLDTLQNDKDVLVYLAIDDDIVEHDDIEPHI